MHPHSPGFIALLFSALCACSFSAPSIPGGGTSEDAAPAADSATPVDSAVAPVDANTSPDATPPQDCDPDTCAAAASDVGGTAICTGNDECVITCQDDRCSGLVCPPGYTCRIACGNSACAGVDCTRAAKCVIGCNGSDSCANTIESGPGPMFVNCFGEDSCPGNIECANSCSCEVICMGEGSCGNQATCTGGDDTCRDNNGCDPAADPSCNTCM